MTAARRKLATTIFSMSLLSLLTLTDAALAQGQNGSGRTGNGSALLPQDANPTSPAETRDNYLKRFPWAKSQGAERSDEAGGSKTISAYSVVLQPCLGGLLEALNGLNDALSALNRQIAEPLQQEINQIQQRIANGTATQQDQQRLQQLQQEIAPLNQQFSQLQGMNRNDLRALAAQEGQLTMINTPAGAGQNSPYQQVQNLQQTIQQRLGLINPWLNRSRVNLSSLSRMTPEEIQREMDRTGQDSTTVQLRHMGMTDQEISEVRGLMPGLSGNNPQMNVLDDSMGMNAVSFITDKKWCFAWDATCSEFPGTPPLPHFFYVQWPKQSNLTVGDGGTGTVPSAREIAALNENMTKTYGLPMSDTQYQQIDRTNKQRLLDLMFDPEKWMWKEQATAHMQLASAANSLGGAAEASFKTSTQEMTRALINIANEDAALGGTGTARAVGMIQDLYKTVFTPIAILLLLPGAVITQFKGPLMASLMGQDEDGSSPFEGILRSIIAIFLIPATQLIISYSIDIGNAMTFAVADPARQWVQLNTVYNWAQQQTFHPSPNRQNNTIQSEPVQGKSEDQAQEESIQENQGFLSGIVQLGYNSYNALGSTALVTLSTYQLVLLCYLFLVGPIVAAFFAWPTGVGNLFRKVFGNWLEAVVVVSLWRFYWCVILAVMTQRIVYVQPDASSEWEMMVFSCFMSLLLFVPFNPFTFQPGAVGAEMLDKAAKAGGADAPISTGGGGGGGGGSSSGGSSDGDSSSSSGGGSATPASQPLNTSFNSNTSSTKSPSKPRSAPPIGDNGNQGQGDAPPLSGAQDNANLSAGNQNVAPPPLSRSR